MKVHAVPAHAHGGADAQTERVACFAQHLAHEIDIMREFLAILDDEAHALSSASGKALAATTARKTSQADKLQAAAQARAAHLITLGFMGEQQDFAPVVARYPDLRPAIDTLVELAAQARAKNQENGVIIQAWQRQHQAALSALQALSAKQENRLYDARGRSKPAAGRFPKTYRAAG